MKTPVKILVLLLAPAALAQSPSWQQQVPEPQPELRGVHMLSAVDGWVVGSGGIVRHTTNGGISFSESVLPSDDLRAVFFETSTLGWVAGKGLFRTLDGGQNWLSMQAPVRFNAVHYVDAQLGWIAGESGVVCRTLDGGQSYASCAQVPGAPEIFDVFFADALNGWVCGAGGVLAKSADGGQSWQVVPSGTGADITSLDFAGASEGWAAAGAQVLHTIDGGLSWTPQPLPPGVVAESVDFIGNLQGWVSGAAGTIAHSSDGGQSWSVQLAAGGGALHAVGMGDLWNGLAVGAQGSIWRTTDGTNWTLVAGGSSLPVPWIQDLAAADAQHAWAAGVSNGVLYTDDGGESWNVGPTGASTYYYGLDFFDSMSGYACGQQQAYFPSLAATHDGGKNWTVNNYVMLVDFHDVAAIDAQTAIACGDTWVMRTTNGGQSWGMYAPQPYGTYFGADFAGQVGCIVGSQVYRSIDGGQSWSHVMTPAQKLRGVSFANATIGWAVGDAGAVLKTTDGGQTWTAQNAGAGANALQAVSAVDAQTVWIAGDGGFIARSSNGGQSWQVHALPGTTSGTLLGAAFVGPDEGWVGGTEGLGIWHREPAGAPCESTAYCTGKVNSVGLSAALGSTGVPSASAGGFSIQVAGGVPGKPGVLFYGVNGANNVPFMGGVLCAQPPHVRLGVQVLDGNGATSYGIGVTAGMVGTSRWYQFWYRDPQHPDGTGVALSDGRLVRFCD
jgi:photosystem II stability/assembly factor-like uncharacterized protein